MEYNRKFHKKIIIAFVIIVFWGCKNEIREYYPNGSLKKETIEINNDTFNVTNYYQNGNIASKGNVYKSKRYGYWIENYFDGSEKWSGLFFNDKRVYEKTIDFQGKEGELFIKDNYDTLYINNEYLIRIKIPGIHPDDLYVICYGGEINYYDDLNQFDYKIKPLVRGNIKINVSMDSKEGRELICIMELPVKE